MDEGSLEAAIDAYNAQLQQVEAAIGACDDPSQQSDLLKLKDDLKQLIELTESSLVSVKKSKLLASLEGGEGEPVGGSLDGEFAAFYSEISATSARSQSDGNDAPVDSASSSSPAPEEEEEEEDVNDMSGSKVRAPYRTSWGTLEYHNAMVVGTEGSHGGETLVRVLYIHPTQKSMKPCPFFLEDKCRFMDDCRFSHGEVVALSELREFLDTDIGNLQEGSSCMARHEDGIWYPAKIIEIDSGYYTVKFDSLLQKDAVVEADSIIPPMREDDPPSSGSEEDDGDYSAFAKVLDSAETEEWTSSCTSDFGGWEVHTRGIGSKLMAKMGYEFGKGLGRNAEGRVEPVMAVVLPKGKSLDQCADLLQKKKLGKDGLTKRRKKTKKAAKAPQGRRNVFDFLNAKLGNQEHPGVSDGGEDAPSAQRNSKEAYKGGKSTKRSINVRLFQATERVAQTEREIERLTESLRRPAGRDKTVITHLEERLSCARQLLAQQKAQEHRIQTEQKKADTHKKMTEF